MTKTKTFLGSKFEMKDMSKANHVLGIRISKDINLGLLYLDPEKYLDKVLKSCNMENCKVLSTFVCKERSLSKYYVLEI